MTTPTQASITLSAIGEAREALGERIVTTPVWDWHSRRLVEALGADTEIWLKLELFQRAGTFKPRGALLNMMALDHDALTRGVTAVSAGNHAIAVGYAAHVLGSTAKVVMPKNADPYRIKLCRSWGAEAVLVDDVHAAFAEVQRIEREEGRTFVHPFDGERTALGTATVGWELAQQVQELDAVIVPVGGGGLAAGIAAATKLAHPKCQVWGVEPEGADSMHRSFAAGKPQAIDQVATIADSLGAPHAAPYSFDLCQKYLDGLVKISDDDLRFIATRLRNNIALRITDKTAAIKLYAFMARPIDRGKIHAVSNGLSTHDSMPRVLGINIRIGGF